MKKKIITTIVIIIAIILLFPLPMQLKDGGSVEYKALVYGVTKYHRLSATPNQNQMYMDGWGIEILGMEIYNSIKEQENKINVTEQIKQESDTNIEEATYSFYATVIKANAEYIIVEPEEGSQERKSSDRISIGLGANSDMVYEVGTKLEITYNGMIMETYPAQINAIRIEIKSADEFELIFNGRKDLGIKTIILKEETDKYSYNIYSYGGDIKIKIDNKEYDLKEALLHNKITMEEIIAKANSDFPNAISYDDGGSMEYHYEDYTIIKCHRLDGNRDVYIGTPKMTINDVL